MWLSITFLPAGNAASFIHDGWSFQEAGGIWAIGSESSLVLPPAPKAGTSRLKMVLWPMIVSPHVSRQRLELSLNGQTIYSDALTVAEPIPITCTVPEGVLRTDSSNNLVLRHPDAAAPGAFSPELGDYRQLSVCLISIHIDVPESPALPLPPPPANPGLVLCHWNATAYEIGCVLEFFPPFAEAFELRFVDNAIPWPVILDELSDADRSRVVAVWEEVDAAECQLARSRPPVPGSVVALTFPRLTMDCLWPLRGPDPRLVPEPPLYPNGRYPYTDLAAQRLIEESAPDDELYAKYLDISRQLMPDLEAELARDVARWRALDACCDVKVGSFILRNFRSIPLFHGPQTPAGPLLAYVVEHLLGSVVRHLSIPPSEVYAKFGDYIHGYQGPFFDQAPVHPLVVEKLGISYLPPQYGYRRGHGKRTFRQHILDYIHWAPWFS